MESYELSKDAAVRIAKAVRQVEDMTFSPRGPMRQQGQPVPVKGWYKIVTNEGRESTRSSDRRGTRPPAR